MKIEYIKPEDIIPYENNPRKNEEAVERVMNSIKEFGFKVPIIVASHESKIIVAGHTRIEAAIKLGFLDKTGKEIKKIKVTKKHIPPDVKALKTIMKLKHMGKW